MKYVQGYLHEEQWYTCVPSNSNHCYMEEKIILLMEQILHQFILWQKSHYLHSFIQVRWCRSSFINRKIWSRDIKHCFYNHPWRTQSDLFGRCDHIQSDLDGSRPGFLLIKDILHNVLHKCNVYIIYETLEKYMATYQLVSCLLSINVVSSYSKTKVSHQTS